MLRDKSANGETLERVKRKSVSATIFRRDLIVPSEHFL
jgi:hypothetical protein